MEVANKKIVSSAVTVTTSIIEKSESNTAPQSSIDVKESIIGEQQIMEKHWKIESVTESEKADVTAENTGVLENGIHDLQLTSASLENNKWEIESIHTIADENCDEDKMPMQVTCFPQSKIINTTDCRYDESSSRMAEEGYGQDRVPVQIHCFPQPPVIDKEVLDTTDARNEEQMMNNNAEDFITSDKIDQNWELHSVHTRDDKMSSKPGSVFVEESWVEHHTIPMQSSSVLLTRKEQPHRNLVYTIIPVHKEPILSRPKILSNAMNTYPIQTSKCNIAIGNLNDELKKPRKDKLRPIDHYSYHYEDSNKTERLWQLTNSYDTEANSLPRISIKSLNKKTVLPIKNDLKIHRQTTDCIKQSIQVDNDDEEIVGVPVILDEHQRPINNLRETQSYNSVTENVNFQIENMNAKMAIMISVEMFHNTDPRTQLWKRKQVKVTRIVDIDLSKVRDKHRLRDIINRCHAGQNGSVPYKLVGPDAYRVFNHLMAITRDEVRDNNSEEDLYVTRGPSGTLTGVTFEPQYLMTAAKGRNATLFLY